MYDSNLINKIKDSTRITTYQSIWKMKNENDDIEQIPNHAYKTEIYDTDDLLKEILRSNNKDEPVN